MKKKQLQLVGIVAMTEGRVIGKEGGLPWHIPADLKFFKKTTLKHPIVMGRKTFDSIGKPLPKRQNIVITRSAEWSHAGVTVIHEAEELQSLPLEQEKAFIIGGAEIYNLLLPHLSELIVTEVKKDYEGDTFFPEFQHLFSHREILQEEEEFTIVSYRKQGKVGG